MFIVAIIPEGRSDPSHTLRGSGQGSALSGSSSSVSGDSRSCEVVNTSLSPEQTSPEALRALGLKFIPESLRLTLKARVFLFQLVMLLDHLRSPLLSLRALLF
jgi:hypothetical protein